ncbi:hypothetical protein D9758_009838 [Tetrapyrgos nigripes]|uniref:Uncharacterized protein n=1 Tax=Tetrapyrgos nigripes TaxID=182062 RepID=A0A8H5GMZ3_9AGAR|nr:hypothetical protein D9758_009838 [Tetrapyrgos nigripes]
MSAASRVNVFRLSTPFYGFELSFLKLIWRIQRNGSWSWTERVSGSHSSIILLFAFSAPVMLSVDVYPSTEGALL